MHNLLFAVHLSHFRPTSDLLEPALWSFSRPNEHFVLCAQSMPFLLSLCNSGWTLWWSPLLAFISGGGCCYLLGMFGVGDVGLTFK
ncbi:hypothetical protein CDAR_27931 [Caerostris darwini]|uniref:Uncharacterized protein n=1 Tax=Caerostris darwini TaxID=1538125 RepID=A0AAV4R8Q7_9ARAC|nr:hypothetical protein CDAR_27931 [Caerostris darwini]